MKKEQEESASSGMYYGHMDIQLYGRGDLTLAQLTTCRTMLMECILRLNAETGLILSLGSAKLDVMPQGVPQWLSGNETTESG